MKFAYCSLGNGHQKGKKKKKKKKKNHEERISPGEDNSSHLRMGVTVYQGSPTITPHTFTIRGWRAERSDCYCISVSQEGGSLRNWTRFFNSFTLFSPAHSLISSECPLAESSLAQPCAQFQHLTWIMGDYQMLPDFFFQVCHRYLRISKVALNSKPVVFRFRIWKTWFFGSLPFFFSFLLLLHWPLFFLFGFEAFSPFFSLFFLSSPLASLDSFSFYAVTLSTGTFVFLWDGVGELRMSGLVSLDIILVHLRVSCRQSVLSPSPPSPPPPPSFSPSW